MASQMPMFIETPVATIPPLHNRLHSTFSTLKTYPLEYRLEQLNKLYWAVKDNEQLLADALHADFRKPYHEVYLTEINWLENVVLGIMKNLREWAKDQPIKGVPMTMSLFNKPKMRSEPLGVVLIIGPSNFPAQLVLHPLIGAIAGGNTAVIKPSELTPNTSAIVTRIVEALDPSAYSVVNGGIPQTTQLLDLKWDKIVYTGSTRVGRIVAAAAAKNLTPVLLELGGLNPVFVTASANATIAAKRTAWGKLHNAGQICIAPNYVLVHPSQEQAFVQGFIQAISTYLPNGAKGSPDMASIIDGRSFERVKGLLQTTKGNILCGGGVDEHTRFIEPTLVKVSDVGDTLMNEEIFGPVLAMLVVDNVDEMLNIARGIGETPLAMYVFSSEKEEQEKLMRGMKSGGVTINDVMLHASTTDVPFGGVGESGHGKYRGRDTFESFVHKRPVLSQPMWIEKQLRLRYSPYTPESLKMIKSMLGDPKSPYGRDWDGKSAPLWWRVLSFGAADTKGMLLRWVVLLTTLWLGKSLVAGLEK
ncbi:uncharacterized protein H6S33_008429 [Morchella sextelata]|uniref:uncharacterized protein n=1 Tax=Morchella sextelata TaxID=1174677 RepID=UPI001D035FBF|nr:uncharacterized protein H6S33_008429 [Morchella sextelata]KAH0602779.1 hypothetical protein H6S33_008429 [Morchella sextelata]